MAFRKIDAEAIWKRDPRAIKPFQSAFLIDCKASKTTWHAIYAWTPEALNSALIWAFGHDFSK